MKDKIEYKETEIYHITSSLLVTNLEVASH